MTREFKTRRLRVAAFGVLTPPLVFYTDIGSGLNDGRENNNGAYLPIFGKHFGGGGLGTTTKLTIGGKEVVAYRSLGASKARSDIHRLTIQIGLCQALPLASRSRCASA